MDPTLLDFLKLIGCGQPLALTDMNFATFLNMPATALLAMGLGSEFVQCKGKLVSAVNRHRKVDLAFRELKQDPEIIRFREKAGSSAGQSCVDRTIELKRGCSPIKEAAFNNFNQELRRPKSPEVYRTQVSPLEHMSCEYSERGRRAQRQNPFSIKQERGRTARPASPDVYSTEVVPYERLCVTSLADKVGERCCGSARGSRARYDA